ncbi:MAG: adenylosuccinate lyase [bacterium]|nr:adenylosuccinate lyase [bacterium]
MSTLRMLSPLDHRYAAQTSALTQYASQYALIRYRVQVEIEWLCFLSEHPKIDHLRPFTDKEHTLLQSWIQHFDETEAEQVEGIEKTINHDVKAVEYYLKNRLSGTSLCDVRESVHFCCTSEDINNLSHALMLKHSLERVWLPLAQNLIDSVDTFDQQTASLPMLAHTHGQPATPTTLGKELAVFAYRWDRQISRLREVEYLGKFNGATGNYNAHLVSYPDLPWERLAEQFVSRLGLTFSPLTTQIESHDYIAELFHNIARFNTILLDFCRDVWAYISLGYFRSKPVAHEVGSSTMPHKVNPIDFENAEANLGVSNALLEHLAAKLPISRLQRDLSDSAALRNIGPALGHSVVALQSALKGLHKLEIQPEAISSDLDRAWEVLGEAVQTVMRKSAQENPYEQLKALTRGENITEQDLKTFVKSLDIPETDRQNLLNLTPGSYTGLAANLIRHLPSSAS